MNTRVSSSQWIISYFLYCLIISTNSSKGSPIVSLSRRRDKPGTRCFLQEMHMQRLSVLCSFPFFYRSIAQLNTCSVDFSLQLFDFSALQFCVDSFSQFLFLQTIPCSNPHSLSICSSFDNCMQLSSHHPVKTQNTPSTPHSLFCPSSPFPPTPSGQALHPRIYVTQMRTIYEGTQENGSNSYSTSAEMLCTVISSLNKEMKACDSLQGR